MIFGICLMLQTKELPLTQALGNKMGGSATNGNTPSLSKCDLLLTLKSNPVSVSIL